MREATFSSKRELEQIHSENQRAFSLEIGRSLSKIRRWTGTMGNLFL